MIAVVSAFLLIDLMGLCNTYGILDLGLSLSSLRVDRSFRVFPQRSSS